MIVNVLLAIAAATVFWFIAAAVLFFNPIVDKIYRSEESHPAVKVLPQSPATIGKILGAVIVQCVLWAGVYVVVEPALGESFLSQTALFGTLISVVKIIPRDIDRVLLTTYPSKRMTIEVVVGLVCAYLVAGAFSWLI